MAFKEITVLKQASDLVIGHLNFHFSNENINITPAGAVPLGTIVFRAKGGAPEAPYTALTTAGVADTNEFAVVFGDHYAYGQDFTPKAIVAGKWNAVGIVRDAAFKEFYIKALYATALGAAPYALLKKLMSDQGLLVLDDVSGLLAA